MMMAVLRTRSTDTLKPRLPTLGHAERSSRCSASSCIAWLLMAIGVLLVSGESSAMPSTTVESHNTTAEDLGAMLDAGDDAVASKEHGVSSQNDACQQQLAEQLTVNNAAVAAVLVVRHNCSSFRQAVVAFIRAHIFQVMATQGWAGAVVIYPGAILELRCELGETATQTSVPAATGSEATLTSQPLSDEGRSPSGATAFSTCRDTAPLDNAAVSCLRRLSGEEKGKKLRQAAWEGKVGEVSALLAAGADVGARDGSDWTALHYAAWGGHVEAAWCLLQAGAEVDARERWQRAPLHLAVGEGHAAVMHLLLAASANPDVSEQDEGWTPLHYAAYYGDPEAATALLEAGADTGARDHRWRTPLDVATQHGRQQLMQILTQRAHRSVSP